jgi:nitric oxide reductase large subunit
MLNQDPHPDPDSINSDPQSVFITAKSLLRDENLYQATMWRTLCTPSWGHTSYFSPQVQLKSVYST